MSTHTARVIKVYLNKHPNADALGLLDGTPLSIGARFDAWPEAGALGAVIEPDTLCPIDRQEFSFLNFGKIIDIAGRKYHRIRPKKFRGVQSDGIVVPAPAGLNHGDDAFVALELNHYEPEEHGGGVSTSRDANRDDETQTRFGTKYDIESALKFSNVLVPGEELILTEKIHGTNARYRFDATIGRMLAGKRTGWVKPGANWWHNALAGCPGIERLCREHPHITVFGEAYGMQKKFGYGATAASPGFVAFDITDENTGGFLDNDTFRSVCSDYGIPTVPVVACIAWDPATGLQGLRDYAEGPSLLGPGDSPCREGVVVRPAKERNHWHLGGGRVILKMVGNGYYAAQG